MQLFSLLICRLSSVEGLVVTKDITDHTLVVDSYRENHGRLIGRAQRRTDMGDCEA
jgi:hypothetical protein